MGYPNPPVKDEIRKIPADTYKPYPYPPSDQENPLPLPPKDGYLTAYQIALKHGEATKEDGTIMTEKEWIAQYGEAIAAANEAAGKANEAADSVAGYAKAAEEAQKEAEKARDEAVSAKTSSEAAKAAAEAAKAEALTSKEAAGESAQSAQDSSAKAEAAKAVTEQSAAGAASADGIRRENVGKRGGSRGVCCECIDVGKSCGRFSEGCQDSAGGSGGSAGQDSELFGTSAYRGRQPALADVGRERLR